MKWLQGLMKEVKYTSVGIIIIPTYGKHVKENKMVALPGGMGEGALMQRSQLTGGGGGVG